MFLSIKVDGSEGFALRKLYSDFLHESASYLGNPGLNAIAGQYLQLSNHWANLAEAALPSQVPCFEQFKSLIYKQAKAYRATNLSEYHKLSKELRSLEKNIYKDFPLDQNGISELLSGLANQMKLISELELSAALRLRDITQS